MTRMGAKSVARESLKRATRACGASTSRWRPLPDFLIIGAKRGGTTSLYFDLLNHPGVIPLFPPPLRGLKPDATKGVHYFDSNAFRSESWYRSYFPTAATRHRHERSLGYPPIAGEASPYYLFHPAAVDRAAALVPRARIIAQLRDPVIRTYSHWKERRRQDAEPLDFLSALAAEPDRLAGEREKLIADPTYSSYAWEQQSYASQSEYAGQVQRWIDAYGSERVHVSFSEDYFAAHHRVISEMHVFLGLPPQLPEKQSHRNAAQGDDLDATTLRKLRAHFEEHNHALSALLGRDLPW